LADELRDGVGQPLTITGEILAPSGHTTRSDNGGAVERPDATLHESSGGNSHRFGSGRMRLQVIEYEDIDAAFVIASIVRRDVGRGSGWGIRLYSNKVEGRNRLRGTIHHDFEVVDGQVRHEVAVAIRDPHIQLNEGRLGPKRRGRLTGRLRCRRHDRGTGVVTSSECKPDKCEPRQPRSSQESAGRLVDFHR
jgi:hypothetical protein